MLWRSHLFAVLRHPDEPRILFLRSDRVWRLPHVLVRDGIWGANAKAVVPAFERRLGTKPWLLRQVSFARDEDAKRIDAVFELELIESVWEAPAHARWVGRAELAGIGLKDEGQRALLEGYLDALERGAVPEERPPWAQPGWLPAVRDWLAAAAKRLGHDLVDIEQVKHWSISSVLRVATDGPDLYFKASARLPLFVEEAMLTARLAERFPGYVPAPLAVEPVHGWLLSPAFDQLFDAGAPFETRQEMLRRFAGLQRRSATLTEELLADGCLDRRLEVLVTQIDPLVADPEAMARLTTVEVAELKRIAPALKQICRRLADFELPPTLVHGDLHMLNVARVESELVYFDWTDACISHPFIDLHSLQWEQDERARAALLDAYLEGWQGAETADRLFEAVSLAAVVIPLHHAVSYQHIVAGLEPAAKRELDVTHEFLREVLVRARELSAV